MRALVVLGSLGAARLELSRRMRRLRDIGDLGALRWDLAARMSIISPTLFET